jgi:hypothetical protein
MGSGGGDPCGGAGIITVPPEMREACRAVDVGGFDLLMAEPKCYHRRLNSRPPFLTMSGNSEAHAD